MTPEETQLLSALVERVRATQLPHTDADAERMIRELTLSKPEAAYILAQTVVMQDYALRQARGRLNDLQRQLDETRAAAAQAPKSGGFFSNLFGNGAPAQNASVPPTAGPWGGRPAAAAYAQQTYAPPPPPNYGAQPGYAPGYAPGYGGGQAPSFLQGAAQTAMGVAGGALLFEGVESLFGGHHGFGGGGFGGGGFGDSTWGGGMPEETVNETVVNNYYDGAPPTDSGYASTDYGSHDQSGFLDTSYDPGTDFGGDSSSFGSDDDSFV